MITGKKINSKHKPARRAGVLLLSALALALVLALTVTPGVRAGEIIEGDPDAVLREGEVVDDDLFIGGTNVRVAGTVEGDLFAAGENVVISGVVNGNVFAAGGTVTVSGDIEGALMIAGYDLTLEDGATIGRNVYFGGFSFQAMRESTVRRSLYGGGYQLILNGSVERDVTGGLSALKVNGPVGGDVHVEIGEPTDGFGTTYNIWQPGLPTIKVLEPGYDVDEDLVGGEVTVNVTQFETEWDMDFQIDPTYLFFQAVRRRVGEFIALMLVGMLALWLARGTLLKAVAEVRSNAGMDTVWGILVYVLYIPVVILLFLVLLTLTIVVSLFTLGSLTGEMITVSSFSFFGLTALFGMLAGLATKVVVGYLVGRWILEKVSQLSYKNYWQHVAALATGLLLYEILRSIPFFGFLLMIVVVVIGTGAFLVMITDGLKKRPSTPAGDAEITPA